MGDVKVAREMTDMDRGAQAAIRLLLRGYETTEGEAEIEITAGDILAAIEREGLRAIVRMQYDYERDFIAEDVEDLYGPFPPELKPLIKGVPKTKWRDAEPETAFAALSQTTFP